jgi:hypothetical protein
MLNKASTKRLAHAVAACGCLAVLALTTPALAQDDEDAPFEMRLFRGIFGGGSKPAIDYRERSPLVIPPSTELPAPDGTTASAGTPNWPNDPDVARRRQAKNSSPLSASDEFERDQRPIAPGEMRRGRVRQSARSTEPVRTPSDGEMIRPLTPQQLGETKSVLGFFRGSGSDKPEAFAGEPDRARMIDPPAGYRTPAPTQPYAPPKESGSWFKPSNWFDRQSEAAER